MSKHHPWESIIDQAREAKGKFSWLEAAQLYEQALLAVGEKDLLAKGEIGEKVGYCFHRAAFQADTNEEFQRRMGSSVEAYETAATLFEGREGSKMQVKTSCAHARALYSKSWSVEWSTRKASLDECQKQLKSALEHLDKTGDRTVYGTLSNELLTCLYDQLWVVWDWQERKNLIVEAIEYGEKAIRALSDAGDDYELARAYYTVSDFLTGPEIYESIEKQEKMSQKALIYAEKALEISEKIDDPFLISGSCLAIATSTMEYKGDYGTSLEYRERALALGKKVNDNLLIARTSDILAYNVWWKAIMEEDPDKRKTRFNQAIQYTRDAITHYQLTSFPHTCYIAEGEYIWDLAEDEINLEKKKMLLEKAVEVLRRDLDHAKHSGIPSNVLTRSHPLSKTLFSLSTLETRTIEKRKLLAEAAKLREETVAISQRLSPFDYWNRGVMYDYLAEIKAEQAKNETDRQREIELVKNAVSDMENCVKLCTRARATQRTMLSDRLAFSKYSFGGILNQLYLLTGEEEHLEKAITMFEEAVQVWEKTDRRSNVAEAHWHLARLYDDLDNFSKAIREFASASKGYKLAADKLPQLKTFYTDYATYMQAWSEIERAKQQHAEKQYGLAKEHYENVANLHKSTERWSYLSLNYSAWARVEEAEDLSRKEQTQEARNLFQQAANLFLESKEAIRENLEKLPSGDESEMATKLSEVSDSRHEYCLGRMALEEAKILDRQGNHAASSGKYAEAAERLQSAIATMVDESDRQEVKPIVDLCQAWQMMKKAEAETSPAFYLEASTLFERAKEHSFDEKTKALALGHSSFCKALEAGTRFEATRDPTLHQAAIRHLESASNYYIRASYPVASEYAKATERLFDAYIYIHNAKTETDPRKKAQNYQMAEKLLQTSAGSYMKAKHPEKSKEIMRLLENIKEERELAISLTQALHTEITSTTTSFATPTPVHEQATGLERFEHADIQANLLIKVKEATVGEDITFRIELVNAGKTPALLIKVNEIIPQGFEVKKVPEVYTVEDSFLNLKGKRLLPLKTEDVQLVVNPQTKGTYTIQPRILYIDEAGKYKSHEPDPVTITVKELGISGWIKGH